MQKRRLGKGGPMVSAVGIGAMSFSNVYGPTNEAESHAVLDAALDLGIDHIDTANVYGLGGSEKAIGSYLAKQGKQKQTLFTIATKAAIVADPKGGRHGFDNSREHLTQELDGSLKRLGLDSVEMLYIHRRDQTIPIEEVTDTLAGFIKAGKIRRFGYSEIAPSSLRRANAVHHVAAVQSEYSLGVRSPELGLVQSCEELETALVAFSPVGRSLLTDHPLDADAIKQSFILQNNPRFQEPNYSANLKIVAGFRKLAADMGTTAAGLCIAWLLHQPGDVIPIPGTRSVAHLTELAAGAHIKLTKSDMETIHQALPLGWAHGDRYSYAQWAGPERYC